MGPNALLSYHEEEARKQAIDPKFRQLLEDYGFGRRGVTMDVGCGLGQTLSLISSTGPCHVGVDVDVNTLRRAPCSEFDSAPLGAINYVGGSGTSLPFRDGVVSHLICRVALNYMTPARAFRELARVLEPGGVLYLRVEAVGYDIRLLRAQKTIRAVASRLFDFSAAMLMNTISADLMFSRTGRVFLSKRVLRSWSSRNELEILELRETGWSVFPTAFELLARKRSRSGGDAVDRSCS